MNFLEICKLWKFPRENKESAHRGRNWEWCSHKPRNANIPQSWKRQETDAPLPSWEGYGCAKTLLRTQWCVMDFRSPSLRENTFVLFEAPELVFICYCSHWKLIPEVKGGISSHVFFHREKSLFSENPLYTSPQVLWTKFQLQGCWKTSIWHFSVQSLCHVRLFAPPWTAACQAPLSFTISRSLLKFMSVELVMPSNHCLLSQPLLLFLSIFPSIRIFSNEAALHIR